MPIVPPLVIPSVDHETRFPRAVEVLKEHGIRSACTLPVTTVHRRLGSLAVGSQEADAYSSEEVSFLSFVANQVALALDATLSFEESQQAQRELQRNHAELQAEHDRLQLLLDVTNQVVSNLELRDLLRAISARVRRVMQCDGVGVALLDSETNQFRIYTQDFPESKGFSREEVMLPVVEDSPKREVRWLTRVMMTGQPLNLEAGDLAQFDSAEDLIAAEGIQSICLLPLISRNRSLGGLGLSRREDKPFRQEDVEFLTLVASRWPSRSTTLRPTGKLPISKTSWRKRICTWKARSGAS